MRKRHSTLPLDDSSREAYCRARNAVAVLGSVAASSTAPRSSQPTARRWATRPSKMLTRAVAQKLVADFLGERAPDMDDGGDAMQLS